MGGLNTYGYVEGNPINLIDPYGLRVLTGAGTGTAGGVGAGGIGAGGAASGIDWGAAQSAIWDAIPSINSKDDDDADEDEGFQCPPWVDADDEPFDKCVQAARGLWKAYKNIKDGGLNGLNPGEAQHRLQVYKKALKDFKKKCGGRGYGHLAPPDVIGGI